MKVKQLIAILERKDPDARVMIMSQSNWPFECSIHGIAVREEFTEADGDEDEDEPTYGEGLRGNDVFIVEGSQQRYGSKAAWGAVDC